MYIMCCIAKKKSKLREVDREDCQLNERNARLWFKIGINFFLFLGVTGIKVTLKLLRNFDFETIIRGS